MLKSRDAKNQIPWRWRLAGLVRSLPEVRGNDRLISLVLSDSLPPDGVHEGNFGPDLQYKFRYRDDGSLVEFFFLQYREPVLAPILETALEPGDTFLRRRSKRRDLRRLGR